MKASISSSSIKYDYYGDLGQDFVSKNAWERQREAAYNETKVGITFLKNVRELVSGYLD